MSPNYLETMFLLRAQNKWDGTMPMSQAKRLIHFIGSDVMQLKKITVEQLDVVRHFLETCDGVFCELPAIQEELKHFGINADVVPFPPRNWYDIQPLPKKKAIAIYLPEGGEEFYFRHLFLGVEEQKGMIHLMKDVDFHVFGNFYETLPKKAKNFKIWGKVNGVQDIIKETSAIVRLTKHDGLPISVAEWIGAGRNALTTVKLPHAEHFDLAKFARSGNVSIADLMKQLKKRIYETLDKPLNEEGAKHYRKWLDSSKYKKTITDYSTYNEKRYWEKRAPLWDRQAGVDQVEVKKLKNILKKLDFDSVLDVGCGNGRFVDYFKDKIYAGCDISKKLIDICKTNYPDGNFFVSAVEDLSQNETVGADLVFCYTVLEHVIPENIDKAVNALKQAGSKLLLIEPKNYPGTGDYCYEHSYEDLFKVEKKYSLGDKWCYIINL